MLWSREIHFDLAPKEHIQFTKARRVVCIKFYFQGFSAYLKSYLM